jgi:hypothetical protein
LLTVKSGKLKELYAFFWKKVPKKTKNATPTLHHSSYVDRKLKGLYAFFLNFGRKKAKNPSGPFSGWLFLWEEREDRNGRMYFFAIF